MSTSTIGNTHAPDHIDDWQPRPELLQAMKAIALIANRDEAATVTDCKIEFANRELRTTITASKVDVATVDGLCIAERIDIRTPLPELFDLMTLEQIAAANTFVTTGAIVRDSDGGNAALVSSLPVFETDTKALEDLYVLIVANGALVQIDGPVAAAEYLVEPSERKHFDYGPPGWDMQSLWGNEEFTHAKSVLRKAGVYCNAGETGFTAEFPWDEGAMSSMLGDRTSLLTLISDNTHPVVGNGLFYRLDLPFTFTRDQLAVCADYLNRYEANGVDTPPFFGAWCSRFDNETLTFAGFWPNCMYRPGTAANIAMWCHARSRIARQVLGNGRIGD